MRSYAVMKFTKALNREIEIGGTRLALTLGDAGVSVRVVGTRKPPWEISWPQVMCHLTDSPDEAAASETIKNETRSRRIGPPHRSNILSINRVITSRRRVTRHTRICPVRRRMLRGRLPRSLSVAAKP
jgi:hypothetical protein